MAEAAVNLIIKAPNQQIKDQVVRCDLGWTIGRLKEYLSEVYPSKPESSHQKLIYSGQLLNDSAQLKDILRQRDGLEDQAYTVHLVCTSQKMYTAKPTSNQNLTIEKNTDTTSSMGNSHIRSASVQNQNHENANATAPPSQMYLPQQYFDPRNSQQLAWMQQAYTHYFTQYMQLMAAQGVQLQASIPYLQQMNINTNDNTPQHTYASNNNNNVVDEQAAQPAAQDAPEINAGNNDVAEDAAFNRDWLDFFYTLSRIILLFGIVYFYSSPLRFLIVTFLGFAIYLYQGGFFRVQPILLGENNNARVDNNNQVLQNEAMGPQAVPQQQNPQMPTPQPEARTNANEENEEQRPGALAFTWTFFSSFFASLIPDQPNVI
ncbi:Homocysteine-responsive endoplasmic reticulum-resident ubiquitin-like domain member 2 protein [Camponotus floridanus]|uniref:Homocysteine-responsive endoplasmic reticulum-resident ubiquitin-like domain member 2 protein n=1 Tax=Camponotus floridanus TaxID=104421 RepID=E2AZ26_CAMFO|nr:homocysteine-responsive endoplasmic reticulum-resident ubiquitin-like domain member 2 protein [Camponotus floridanus]EFN61321.1 Homocysteine-responsive endoplasmic reticulum-resident ubiquitin-like domain member 2 protein [Camponotus floridanus]